jgi:hypothetical protein
MIAKILSYVLITVLFLAGVGLVAQAADGPPTIPWGVFSSGGASVSSASYSLEGSLGQTAIGSSTSANHGIDSGFWYADLQAQTPTEQKVYLPLVVR